MAQSLTHHRPGWRTKKKPPHWEGRPRPLISGKEIKADDLTEGERGGKSPSRLPSQPCLQDSSAHSSPLHSPSHSPTCSKCSNISWPHQGNGSWSSSASSAYSHSTAKESHMGSGRGSDDKASSTMGNASEHEKDEGSPVGGSGGEDSGSKGGSEGEGSHPKGSGSEGKYSGSRNESGSRSGSSSSTSQLRKKPQRPNRWGTI